MALYIPARMMMTTYSALNKATEAALKITCARWPRSSEKTEIYLKSSKGMKLGSKISTSRRTEEDEIGFVEKFLLPLVSLWPTFTPFHEFLSVPT